MLNYEKVPNNEIKCPYCGYETVDTWEMNDGKPTYAEEYFCEECDKKFYWSREYTVRIEVAKSCILNNEECFFEHYHNQLYRCNKCGETVSKKYIKKAVNERSNI